MKNRANFYQRKTDVYPMKIFVCLFLLNFIFACSEKEKVLLQDNISDKNAIESPVKVSTPELSEGNRKFLNGDYKGAISYYEKGLNENRAVAYYNIGVSYFLTGNYVESSKYFKEAYGLDNSFTESYLNLAASYIELDMVEEAEKIIKNLEKTVNSSKFLVNSAYVYLKKGNTAKALYYIQEAYKLGGDKEFINIAYGSYLLSVGEFDNAVEIIEKIRYKGFSEYYNLSLAYYNLNDFNKSVLNAKNALEISENVLAYLVLGESYVSSGDYILGAEVYKNIIKLDDRVDYRIKYAFLLYKSGDKQRALTLLSGIIKDFPYDKRGYLLKYRIYNETGDVEKATDVIGETYAKIKDDEIIFKYVWHYVVRLEKSESVKDIIFSKTGDDLSNVLKGLYFLKEKELDKAKGFLDKVNNLRNSDYYLMLSYYYLKKGEYEDAIKSSDLIDDSSPESLWYKFVSFWNLKDENKLLETARMFHENIKIFSKKPKVSIKLKPVRADFNLSFPFELKYEDILKLSLTPIPMNPGEMVEFLSLGYKLLKDNENFKALEELKKSVKFAESIELNNKGVEEFFDFNFGESLKLFSSALKNLDNNPIILYNIGLCYLNLGDRNKAFYYFDRATVFNRFVLQGYLGKAVVLKDNGDNARGNNQYDMLLSNYELMKVTDEKISEYFSHAVYFAEIGLGRYDKVLDGIIGESENVEFYKYLSNLSFFYKTGDNKYMDAVKNVKIFRSRELYSLFRLYKEKIPLNIIETDDIYYQMASFNILSENRIDYKKIFSEEASVLNDEIYRKIFLGDLKSAFTYLQIFSKRFFRQPQLYKISLYYFMINNDKLNAEASMSSLDRLGFKDIWTDYYKILYFLVFYNEKRVTSHINTFIENYPYDFRGIMGSAVLSFKNSNFKNLYNDIINISTFEKDFLKKTSILLEVDDL